VRWRAGAFPIQRQFRSEASRRHLKEKTMPDKMGVSLTAAAVAAPAPVPPHATVLSSAKATQGIKLGHMRYVLGIGLALAVIAGVAMAVFFTH
jgi:hypothetical protein